MPVSEDTYYSTEDDDMDYADVFDLWDELETLATDIYPLPVVHHNRAGELYI